MTMARSSGLGASPSGGKSKKTEVIEIIFDRLWDAQNSALTRSVVTLSLVGDAIKAANRGKTNKERLSAGNLANFFKDFIRNKDSANRNWPASVFSRGYTAVQRTGKNACFEFVPLKRGQTEPFPLQIVHTQSTGTPHELESVSMPLASRRLGRRDESWLMQVLVRLRVIETHLALTSSKNIVQLDLLQMSIKQRGSEIDGLFLAVEEATVPAPGTRELLVICEAKMRRDDILEDQIVSQVKTVAQLKGVAQEEFIPMAAKLVGPSQVFVVEFESVPRSAAANLTSLVVVSQQVYELVPAVPGLG
jgi:hypothetical protein